jgi:HemY protein
MLRIILFLILIALAAAGAAWIAEQPGSVVLTWSDFRASPDLPTFVLIAVSTIVAVTLAFAIVTGLVRLPGRMKRGRSARRRARASHAITHGLLAVGHGDSTTARAHANTARRHAPHDPLSLLLQAQTAQLEGDRDGARRAFLAMAGRDDTKSLGMRGLYIEAQRADDPYAALTIAEEALRLQPNSAWASAAVLGYRCARADWVGALEILENSLTSGLVDKKAYRRQRAVLLTARAIETEDSDESVSRDSALEANKLAPSLIPAAVLASKHLVDTHQARKAMKVIEVAWQTQPHPDLAAAYADTKPGDTPDGRLARIANLIGKTPSNLESALALSRAAIDAGEFGRARTALAPYIDNPTQRVAMLMAELEHGERGDTAKARAWTLRAVRALHDAVWTADGYVSDHWRPVSPVTGRLDAFQWQVPVAALPSSRAVVIDDKFHDALIASAKPEALPATDAEPVTVTVETVEVTEAAAKDAPTAARADEKAGKAKPGKDGSDAVVTSLFHRRPATSAVPPVIPIVRAPDDPGVEDHAAPAGDHDAEPPPAGGWRSFRPRPDA